MIRVAVVGTSCSGKTTLARRIAGIKGIPHIELDAIHWGTNWTSKPIDELRAEINILVAQDEWVIDGNYSKLRDIIWSRATHLVWLNLPFPRVFWQALSRTAKRVFTREELWAGNRETLRLVLFDRDSILLWVIQTHRRNSREYRRLIESGEYGHLQVYELKSPRATEDLLEDLSDLN
jgi:adenylate kinase family enzyme